MQSIFLALFFHIHTGHQCVCSGYKSNFPRIFPWSNMSKANTIPLYLSCFKIKELLSWMVYPHSCLINVSCVTRKSSPLFPLNSEIYWVHLKQASFGSSQYFPHPFWLTSLAHKEIERANMVVTHDIKNINI